MKKTAKSRPDAFLSACPSRQVMARVGDKWSMLALSALESAPMRFGELRRRLDGISQKMLTQTLRALERDGLIARHLYDERPLRVEYALSARGRALLPLVQSLKAWAERELSAVMKSNTAYDRAMRNASRLLLER